MFFSCTVSAIINYNNGISLVKDYSRSLEMATFEFRQITCAYEFLFLESSVMLRMYQEVGIEAMACAQLRLRITKRSLTYARVVLYDSSHTKNN